MSQELKILSICADYVGNHGTTVDVSSHASILDFDVAIADFSTPLRQMISAAGESNAGKIVAVKTDSELRQHLSRWQSDITEFLKHDRVVVVFPYVADAYSLIDPSRSVRETGPPEFPLLGLSSTNRKRLGSRIYVTNKTPISNFLNRIASGISYRAILSGSGATTCAVIEDTTSVIAAYKADMGGHLIFLPELHLARLAPSELGRSELATSVGLTFFVTALKELARELVRAATTTPPATPEWAAKFYTKEESAVEDRIGVLGKQLQEGQTQLDSTKLALNGLQEKKALFCSQGGDLVNAVAAALSTLGFQVKPGPEGRDDLVIEDGGKVGVIEVKGRLNSSAGEKDAAQLEKWVSGHFENHGVEPKGILVVNAYASLPLSQRVDSVFPNQMIDYVTRKSHCLLSGLQLFCLVEATSSEIDKAKLRSRILTHVGEFPDYQGSKWETCLFER